MICERLVGLVSFETNVSKTAAQIHEIELVYRDDLSRLQIKRMFSFAFKVEVCLKIKCI